MPLESISKNSPHLGRFGPRGINTVGGKQAPTVTMSTANLLANATSITITGTNFSTNPGSNTVTFNNSVTGTVTASTSTSLTVTSLSGVSSLSNGTSLTAIVTTNGVSSGAAVQVATIQVTPLTIFGSNLVAWYRTGAYQDTDLITNTVGPVYCQNNGDVLTQWNDKSSSSFNLSQGTLANKTTYSTTTTLNGVPTIACNGSTDFIANTGAMPNSYTAISVFLVVKPANISNQQNWFDANVVSGSTRYFIRLLSTGFWILYSNGVASANGPAATTGWTKINAVFNGGSSLLRTNGGTDSNLSINAGSFGANGILIGLAGNGAYPANGNIAEVVVAGVAANSTQRSQLDSYALSQWGF